uniref:Tick transposon n=1 Tax=Ixodes ricinus TaxID=34613 RepID=A0A090X9V5_IXORI
MSAGQLSSQVDRPTYHLEPERAPSGTLPHLLQPHGLSESSEDDSPLKDDTSDMDDSGGSQAWTESRGKKRRRKSGGSGTSGTTSRRQLEEGFTVLFAPTNSDSVASLSRSKLTEYVECAAPGAVKEVRVNKARNLIAVDAKTPKLKEVLLGLTVLCTTPVRAFLPSPPNTCLGLIRDVELGISDADIRNQIRDPVKIWDVRRLGEKSKLVKIVFLGKTRPDSLLYGLVRTPVLPFKVKALQCRRCFHYGHIAAVCNRPQVCARCGGSHDGMCESSVPKCINCRQSHEASSPSCPTRRREVAISRYRSENNATFREAREALRKSSSAKPDGKSRSVQGITPSDKTVATDARPSPIETHAPVESPLTCSGTDATPGASHSASGTTVKQTWAESVKSSKPSNGRVTQASRQGAGVSPSAGHMEAAAPVSSHPFKFTVTMIFTAVRELIRILPPASSFRKFLEAVLPLEGIVGALV